jgi:hypothetical protein
VPQSLEVVGAQQPSQNATLRKQQFSRHSEMLQGIAGGDSAPQMDLWGRADGKCGHSCDCKPQSSSKRAGKVVPHKKKDKDAMPDAQGIQAEIAALRLLLAAVEKRAGKAGSTM